MARALTLSVAATLVCACVAFADEAASPKPAAESDKASTSATDQPSAPRMPRELAVLGPVQVCATNDCGLTGKGYSVQQVLGALHRLLSANDGLEYKLCESDKRSRQCIAENVGHTVFALVLPGQGTQSSGTIRSPQLSPSGDVIRLRKSDPKQFSGSDVTCSDHGGAITANASGEIVLIDEPYSCRWGLFGVMTAEFSFAIESIDLEKGRITGFWAHKLTGTGHGSGTGFAALQLQKGMPLGENWLQPRTVEIASGAVVTPSFKVADEKPQGATSPTQAGNVQQPTVRNLAKLMAMLPPGGGAKLATAQRGLSDSQKAQFWQFLADASDNELREFAAKLDAGQLQGNWWESGQPVQLGTATAHPRVSERPSPQVDRQVSSAQTPQTVQSQTRPVQPSGASASSDTVRSPELIVQHGHSKEISALAFSPDGRWIASGGNDNIIALWDVASGNALRSLVGHPNRVRSVAFNRDARWLASVSEEKGADFLIRIWDVSAGREAHQLRGHTSQIRAIAFHPAGVFLASAGADKNIRLWEVGSARLVQTWSGHKHDVSAIAFSDDGRLFASGDWERSLKVWEFPSGREVLTLIDDDPARHKGERTIVHIAFSPDSRLIASLYESNRAKVWDAQTGRAIRSIESPGGNVEALAFSADGRLLITAAGETVRFWDIGSGKNVHTAKDDKLSGRLRVVSFDRARLADAGGFASADQQGVRVFRLEPWGHVQTLQGGANEMARIAFTADGSLIHGGLRRSGASKGQSASTEGFVAKWERNSGRQLRSTGAEFRFASRLVLGEGSYAAEDSLNITVHSLASGQVVSRMRKDGFTKWALSRDGRQLAYRRGDDVVLASVESMQPLRVLKEEGRDAGELAFSPTGHLLASARLNKIIVWDTATGAAPRAVDAKDMNSLSPLALSPDGRLVAMARNRDLTVLEVDTGRELARLRSDVGDIGTLSFSPDSRWLAAATRQLAPHAIKVWEVGTGRDTHTLRGHNAQITSLAFSPDGQIIASTSHDGTTRLWDSRSGEAMAILLSMGSGDDWAIVTPDGLFDGSANAWQRLLWRFGGRTLDVGPLEMFFNEFYYPGLLSDLLQGRRPTAPRNIADLDRRQPDVKLTLAGKRAPSEKISTRSVTVRVDVAEAISDQRVKGSGVRDVRLFRNGALVKVWRGDVISGKGRATLETSVPVMAGENRFTAYAFNRDNIKSADTNITITGDESLKRPGTAHIVVVGINEYANPDYNLKYAVADAKAFGDEMLRQQGKLGVYSRVEVIPLLDRDATKANVLAALTRLAGAGAIPGGAPASLQKVRPAQPEDAVVIYFAGHGIADGPRFYLLPHDLGYAGSRSKMDERGRKMLLSRSISDLDLEKAFEKVDAGRLTLIIDACESGQALEAEEKRRGPMNSKGLAQLAYEKGMYVLTAAQGYQAALEAEKLGHGVFTYALVQEGLKTAAADTSPKDGQVDAREWFEYAAARVPELQMAMMEEGRRQGRDIAFVDGERSISDLLKRTLQRPRAFYRPEPEGRPFIVAKP